MKNKDFLLPENIILSISVFLILASLTITYFVKTPMEKYFVIIINFFGTVVFSWLLTRKTSEQEFQERQKESARRSYRHTLETEKYSKYVINEINVLINTTQDNTHRAELCKIRDSVIGIAGYLKTSISDWGDILKDEYKKITEFENYTIEHAKLLQELNLLKTSLNDSKEKNEQERETSKNKIQELLQELSTLRLKIKETNEKIPYTMKVPSWSTTSLTNEQSLFTDRTCPKCGSYTLLDGYCQICSYSSFNSKSDSFFKK